MRRRFQAGSIRKRGKRYPVWEARYYEPVMKQGRLIKVRRGIILGPCQQMTKGQARRRFQEILQPLNEGLHSPSQAIKFGDFCDKWKKEIGTNYRESTRRFYESTLDRWIVPHF